MFRRGIVLNPSYAQAHVMLGHLLSQIGRHDEAATALERARELDPRHPMHLAISALVAYQARNYPAALDYAQQSVNLDQDFWIGHQLVAQGYADLGRADLALDALSRAARLSSGNNKTISFKGYLLAKLGRRDEARQELLTLIAASSVQYVPPVTIALVYAGLDERDSALEWLHRAVAARDVHFVFLTRDPKWDSYRGDPRFRALLDRGGFASQ